MTRMYPCQECADHFREIVRRACVANCQGWAYAEGLFCRDHPPAVQSSVALQQWMCEAHNEVNSSIGKPSFNCRLANKRWGELECDELAACKLVSRR